VILRKGVARGYPLTKLYIHQKHIAWLEAIPTRLQSKNIF